MFNLLQSFPLGRGACEIKIMKLISVTGRCTCRGDWLLCFSALGVASGSSIRLTQDAKHTVTSPPVAFKF